MEFFKEHPIASVLVSSLTLVAAIYAVVVPSMDMQREAEIKRNEADFAVARSNFVVENSQLKMNMQKLENKYEKALNQHRSEVLLLKEQAQVNVLQSAAACVADAGNKKNVDADNQCALQLQKSNSETLKVTRQLSELNSQINVLKSTLKETNKRVVINLELATLDYSFAPTDNTISVFFSGDPAADGTLQSHLGVNIAGKSLPKASRFVFDYHVSPMELQQVKYLYLVNSGSDCWFPQNIRLVIDETVVIDDLKEEWLIRGAKGTGSLCLQNYNMDPNGDQSYLKIPLN